MTIALSIVSGTYNRLPMLQRMINSARVALPWGLPYEFVIVDGGSDDGTLEWLRDQPDVRLIEHGELRGAIPAFCDGAKAARGEYVLLANDDITFHPLSITRAIRHLEQEPTCGGVAFADDRPVQGYTQGAYKTQIVSAVAPDGRSCIVTYAQVGLFRRWLGDAVGWWGADDPIMGHARTYGGDNYLSARVWEAGYSVDPVPGCVINDHIPQDQLRIDNGRNTNGGMHPDSARYQERFPNGPHIAAEPQIENPQRRHLRVLYLPIYEPGHEIQRIGKAGLRRALKKAAWLYEVDYLRMERNDISAIVKAWQPDLMLCQFQDATNVTPDQLAYWRRLAPGMLVVNWHGDARGLTEDRYLQLLAHVDLQLVVNAAPLETYAEKGIRAAYWQIGYEEAQGELPEVKAHDVVFLGNAYSDDRKRLESVLTEALGRGVCNFYGSGWMESSGSTLYDFSAGEAIYHACKIALSDTFPGQLAFVSNRFFQAAAAGAFVLQQHIPEFETFTGIVEGKHYIEWTDLDDLTAKIAYWLDPAQDARRKKIAKAGQRFVRERFSFDTQVRRLFDELLPALAEETTREPA